MLVFMKTIKHSWIIFKIVFSNNKLIFLKITGTFFNKLFYCFSLDLLRKQLSYNKKVHLAFKIL